MTEAINSMFGWYQRAQQCYAYLEDVVWDSSTVSTGSIVESEWFSRGWTLQELIAPPSVRFYSKDWFYLGSTKTHERSISEFCGIDPGILSKPIPISNVSVAEKMRWASERQTTRVEDIAYCLLGIFDINMPLLYGEGMKAFQRLQEEIIKRTDDHSIFAWTDKSASNATFCSLLAPSPANFDNSGGIERIIKTTGCPFAITNRGLNISLLLREVGDEGLEYLGLLDCKRRHQPDAIAIRIKRMSTESDQCARVDPGYFSSICSSSTCTLENFYVPERLTTIAGSTNLGSRVVGFKIRVITDRFHPRPDRRDAEIVSVWPSDGWPNDKSLIRIDSADIERYGVARSRVVLSDQHGSARLLVCLSYEPGLLLLQTSENDPSLSAFAWEISCVPNDYSIDQEPHNATMIASSESLGDIPGDRPYSSRRYVNMEPGFDGTQGVILVAITVAYIDLDVWFQNREGIGSIEVGRLSVDDIYDTHNV